MRRFHSVPSLASTAVALVLAAGAVPSPAGQLREGHVPPAIEQLAWLAGSWGGETDGVLAEEHWIEPAGGLMLGMHRDVHRSGKAFFEYLRIERREDGIYLVASPMGRTPGTPFRLVRIDGTRAEFHNPEHDFPQKIAYWLDDAGGLHARVEGVGPDGETRAGEWVWQPAP